MANSRETLDDDAITRVDNATPVPEQAAPFIGATISAISGSEAGRLFYLPASGGIFGRGEEADFTFSDATISREHIRIDLHEGQFYLRDLDSMNGTYVDDERVWNVMRLPTACRIRLGRRTLFQFTAVDQLGADAFRQLCRALFIDSLTGTGNRSYLEQRMREEIAFAARHRETVGLLLIDLDHFKDVNDEFGHMVGDEILRHVGRILRETVRTEDSVYRYGGEEFCVLVRGESDQGLEVMGDRIRRAIEAFTLDLGAGEIRVTGSVGVASIANKRENLEATMGTISSEEVENSAETDEMLLTKADTALYQAKEQGRNRVVVFSE